MHILKAYADRLLWLDSGPVGELFEPLGVLTHDSPDVPLAKAIGTDPNGSNCNRASRTVALSAGIHHKPVISQLCHGNLGIPAYVEGNPLSLHTKLMAEYALHGVMQVPRILPCCGTRPHVAAMVSELNGTV